jgi:hypothetical protein
MEQDMEPCYCSQLMRLGNSLLWTLTLRRDDTHTHFTVTCTADTPVVATIDRSKFGDDEIRMMTSMITEHYSHHGANALKRVAYWIQKCGREIME